MDTVSPQPLWQQFRLHWKHKYNFICPSITFPNSNPNTASPKKKTKSFYSHVPSNWSVNPKISPTTQGNELSRVQNIPKSSLERRKNRETKEREGKEKAYGLWWSDGSSCTPRRRRRTNRNPTSTLLRSIDRSIEINKTLEMKRKLEIWRRRERGTRDLKPAPTLGTCRR